MTANADSRYQMLLHVAAWSRRRCATAALKSTYTASVSAVEASTPTATSGSSFIIRLKEELPLALDATQKEKLAALLAQEHVAVLVTQGEKWPTANLQALAETP